MDGRHDLGRLTTADINLVIHEKKNKIKFCSHRQEWNKSVIDVENDI